MYADRIRKNEKNEKLWITIIIMMANETLPILTQIDVIIF